MRYQAKTHVITGKHRILWMCYFNNIISLIVTPAEWKQVTKGKAKKHKTMQKENCELCRTSSSSVDQTPARKHKRTEQETSQTVHKCKNYQSLKMNIKKKLWGCLVYFLDGWDFKFQKKKNVLLSGLCCSISVYRRRRVSDGFWLLIWLVCWMVDER